MHTSQWRRYRGALNAMASSERRKRASIIFHYSEIKMFRSLVSAYKNGGRGTKNTSINSTLYINPILFRIGIPRNFGMASRKNLPNTGESKRSARYNGGCNTKRYMEFCWNQGPSQNFAIISIEDIYR